MKKVIQTFVAANLAKKTSRMTGTNPLVSLAAASVATRIATASIPLALVVSGGIAAWSRYKRKTREALPPTTPAVAGTVPA